MLVWYEDPHGGGGLADTPITGKQEPAEPAFWLQNGAFRAETLSEAKAQMLDLIRTD